MWSLHYTKRSDTLSNPYALRALHLGRSEGTQTRSFQWIGTKLRHGLAGATAHMLDYQLTPPIMLLRIDLSILSDPRERCVRKRPVSARAGA
jgi:hypothetical protein